MICLHGLGGRKEGMASYTDELARRGFVGVAIDARYHGDRAGNIQLAMAESFRTGKEHPYLWDTAWDTWRVLDYLEARPDVDRSRLGVMGTSLGGHTTWMVSADPRVKVAVPCIAVCSWRWQLEHEGYTQRVKNLSVAFDGVKTHLGEKEVTPKVVAEAWRRWLPGIPEKYDCQDLLAAFAPKPLLILNGDTDPVTPLEGVKVAVADIEAAYRRAGASDRLRVIIAEKSGHTITPTQREALFEWLDRWLKK
jgi:dienelactone hydrolase